MFASKDVFLKSSGGGYTIARSVRFRSSASAYLNRTPTVASNRQTWTWSGWVKRGKLGATQGVFARNDASVATYIQFTSSDTLTATSVSGAVEFQIITTQVFRDPSAWYHIVIVLDTTQATSSNRVKLYVNGAQITALGTASYPSQNYNAYVNTVATHYIGNGNPAGSLGWYSDQYLTEINFIDGQALTPSSFGAISSTTGVWQPIAYTGTYGTNGFYLKFNSFATAAALGTDSSGNGNTWTVNNISVTAGTTYDSMTDVPTLTSATAANYAVMNPVATSAQGSTAIATLTNGNLTISGNGTTDASGFSTVAIMSGKWYIEFTCSSAGGSTSFSGVGIAYNFNNTARISGVLYSPNGQKRIDNTLSSYGSTYTSSDVIGIAIDATANSITFYKNNTSQGAISYTPATPNVFLNFYDVNQGTNFAGSFNFGQQGFTYTPPSGFVALNTYNLSTPTIPNGAVYMAATTWSGTGSALTIANTVNGTNFQPDFVWIKARSTGSYGNYLSDVVRGNTKYLSSQDTSAEITASDVITSFNTNGFSLSTSVVANGSGQTYIGWQWKANGAGVSNTSGSITSTVSANTTAGFAVVTYTGTGVAATIGHGLGVAPSMLIVKPRSATGDWIVYTSTTGAGNFLLLDTTAASAASLTKWNNTAPTSSVFSVGIDTTTNTITTTYVAYVFAAVAGYSAFGSYTGNGSTDGPFVYLGFRPRFILFKRTDAVSDWRIHDTTRAPYNVETIALLANSAAAEDTGANAVDELSNGFKCRDNGAFNTASATYFYMAFAENPFKYSLAR